MPQENATVKQTEMHVDETASEEKAQTPQADEASKASEKEEKTYTQADVDNLINIQKAKLPPEKEWKAFKAWQAEQKKEADSKLDEETRQRIAQQEAENRRLQAQVAALKLGVKAEATDDVVTLATARLSDTVTMDQAIRDVLQAYPSLASNTAQETSKQPAIVVPQENKPIATGGVNSWMNDIIRGKKGN